MKVLFLSDNFPPEYNAPATRTHEHCKEWVKKGVDVTVVTCFPNFPTGKIFNGYRNKLTQNEIIDGIKIIRVWSYITSNSGFFRRTLDFISYAITSFFRSLFVKTDIIVATSPQFFTAISGYLLSVIKNKPWIMEVRDLWPESIKAVDAVKSNKIINWLEKLELFLYRSTTKIIVVTDAFKSNLVERGIEPEKIHVVKNGANLEKYQPQQKNKNIQKQMNLNGSFVFGYIGTHGLAHSLEFIITSIGKLSKSNNYKFLFIGDGAEKQNVIKLSEKLNLDNVIFCDPVKKEDVADYLSIIDVAIVPLKKSDTFKSVIPSKIFESCAMHKPILLGVDGESRQIIEHYNAGEYFEPENEEEFLKKIKLISENCVEKKYDQGCHNLANEFDRKKLALNLLDIIKSSCNKN